MKRLSRILAEYRSSFAAAFQGLLILVSLVVSWLLRFDFSLPDHWLLLWSAPILVVVRLAAIAWFNLLRGWWRYSSVGDALNILKAVACGSLGFVLVIRYGLGIVSFPRSIFVLEALTTGAFLAGARLFSRALAEYARTDLAGQKKVLLIGAGFAAQMIIREARRPDSGYEVVACVDDDRSKQGIRVHGVPVRGTVDDLPALLRDFPVDEVLIAVPSATGEQMRRFVAACERGKARFRTVPALRDIISGTVSIAELRDVRLEDLLGREPVCIDLESVRKELAGKAIAVTGAAGSIGSELCRQVLDYSPARLVCLDQSETGMFCLQQELTRHKGATQLEYCVADVSDRDRIRDLFAEYCPQVVFHAAAYKHVPMMERNVHEAVKNNVFGLLTLLGVASGAHCEKFVLISSDKAVNPSSVMGATKRIGELILSAYPGNGMRCVSVRFGNVLGSNGSVVPVLQEQLRSGRPLTITHPDIQRFFMTTREAVALVLQAFAIGSHGDVLVLDMGKPVRIVDLARELIRLSGKTESEVAIEFTGLRDGEKLQEELFYAGEEVLPTICEKIKRTRNGLNRWPQLRQRLDALRASLNVNGAAPVRRCIQQIVPEYSYASERFLAEPAAEKARCKAASAD